jgi:hypothetical protein
LQNIRILQLAWSSAGKEARFLNKLRPLARKTARVFPITGRHTHFNSNHRPCTFVHSRSPLEPQHAFTRHTPSPLSELTSSIDSKAQLNRAPFRIESIHVAPAASRQHSQSPSSPLSAPRPAVACGSWVPQPTRFDAIQTPPKRSNRHPDRSVAPFATRSGGIEATSPRVAPAVRCSTSSSHVPHTPQLPVGTLSLLPLRQLTRSSSSEHGFNRADNRIPSEGLSP